MVCPVCETPALEDAAECATCGKVLASEAEILEDIEAVPGLEYTMFQEDLGAPRNWTPGGVEVEQTQLQEDPAVPSRWSGGAEVERTFQQEDPSVPSNWTVGPVEIDPGREPGAPLRTAVTEETFASDEIVLCPACFARVPAGPRCVECGVPLVVSEAV